MSRNQESLEGGGAHAGKGLRKVKIDLKGELVLQSQTDVVQIPAQPLDGWVSAHPSVRKATVCLTG